MVLFIFNLGAYPMRLALCALLFLVGGYRVAG